MTDILPQARFEAPYQDMPSEENWEAAETAALEARNYLILATTLEDSEAVADQHERGVLLASAEREFTTFYDLTVNDTRGVVAMHIIAPSPSSRANLINEAVQDTYRRAFTALPAFEKRSRVSTWMYRIATNTAISAGNRERKHNHQTLYVDTHADDQSGAQLDVRAAVVDAVSVPDHVYRRELLQGALGELSMSTREVVVLRTHEDMDFAAIGQKLGMSETAAKVRFFRARKIMRTYLEQMGIQNYKDLQRQ